VRCPPTTAAFCPCLQTPLRSRVMHPYLFLCSSVILRLSVCNCPSPADPVLVLSVGSSLVCIPSGQLSALLSDNPSIFPDVSRSQSLPYHCSVPDPGTVSVCSLTCGHGKFLCCRHATVYQDEMCLRCRERLFRQQEYDSAG
jgi:hypothetical protein